jgi:hypothetical protein
MEGANDNHKLVMPLGNPQLVIWLNGPGGLDPLAVKMDTPTDNSLTGQSPGLEKPGRPKPFVNPYFLLLTSYTQL